MSELEPFLDKLRELGLDDVARWVEHPDAVRVLLGPTEETDEDGYVACAKCGMRADGAHLRDCEVLEAWRVLGDGRYDLELDRAWDEALGEEALFRQWRYFSTRSSEEERLSRSAADLIEASMYGLRVAEFHAPLLDGPRETALPSIQWRRYNEGADEGKGE